MGPPSAASGETWPMEGPVFLFAAGRLRTDVNGLWQDHFGTYGPADTWYFLADGQVVDYTGVAEYNGSFFVVEKGVFNNTSTFYHILVPKAILLGPRVSCCFLNLSRNAFIPDLTYLS